MFEETGLKATPNCSNPPKYNDNLHKNLSTRLKGNK